MKNVENKLNFQKILLFLFRKGENLLLQGNNLCSDAVMRDDNASYTSCDDNSSHTTIYKPCENSVKSPRVKILGNPKFSSLLYKD